MKPKHILTVDPRRFSVLSVHTKGSGEKPATSSAPTLPRALVHALLAKVVQAAADSSTLDKLEAALPAAWGYPAIMATEAGLMRVAHVTFKCQLKGTAALYWTLQEFSMYAKGEDILIRVRRIDELYNSEEAEDRRAMLTRPLRASEQEFYFDLALQEIGHPLQQPFVEAVVSNGGVPDEFSAYSDRDGNYSREPAKDCPLRHILIGEEDEECDPDYNEEEETDEDIPPAGKRRRFVKRPDPEYEDELPPEEDDEGEDEDDEPRMKKGRRKCLLIDED